jgi:hypothetical protein
MSDAEKIYCTNGPTYAAMSAVRVCSCSALMRNERPVARRKRHMNGKV